MNLVIPCGSAGARPDLGVSYSEIGDHVLRLRARAEARGVELVWYSPLPLCLFNTIAHGLGNRGLRRRRRPPAREPVRRRAPLLELRPRREPREPAARAVRGDLAVARGPLLPGEAMMPIGCESCPEAAACQGACVLYWRERGVAELGRPAQARPRLPEGFRSVPASPAGS